MTFYVLKNGLEAFGKFCKQGGWDSVADFIRETGCDNPESYYWMDDDGIEEYNPEELKKLKKLIVSPIGIVVHNRLFSESAEGYIDGDKLLVKESLYDGLF